MTIPRVVMICGKICSGKTTYSKKICKQEKAVLLSVDELMIGLFGQNTGDRHDEYVEKIKEYFLEKTVELINAGTSVVLDWGLWTRSERTKLKSFYSERNIAAEIHYIELDDIVWQKRIAERNEAVKTDGSVGYYIDENLKHKFNEIFEIPEQSEIDRVIK